MFSEASNSSTGDFLICKGDSEKGEVGPKDGGAVRVGGSTERFDDMLLAAKRPRVDQTSNVLTLKVMEPRCEENVYSVCKSGKKWHFIAWLVNGREKRRCRVNQRNRRDVIRNMGFHFISFGGNCKAEPTAHLAF
jgi:hypothetical protein